MYKSVLNSKMLKAVVGVFCAIVLVFSAFFLPYEIKTKAENPWEIVIDFENGIGNYTGTGAFTAVDMEGRDSTVSKVLKTSAFYREARNQLLKDEYLDVYTIPAGTYKVTYDYKVENYQNQEVKLLYGIAEGNYYSGTAFIDNLIVDKTSSSEWRVGTCYFALDKEITNLGIGTNGNGTGSVYIDNIVITKLKAEDKDLKIDFEEDTANHTTTTMVEIVEAEGKGGATTKMLYAKGVSGIRTQLIKDKNGETYSLKAGTYTMTYDYLVPQNGNQELYILHNVMVDYKVLDGNSKDHYTSGRKLSTTNLLKDTTKGNTWVRGEITFTLDNDVYNIGFGLKADYGMEAYIDNVVITLATPDDEDDNDQVLDNYHSTPTLTVDFENHTEHDMSGVYAISNDPAGGNRGKNLGVVFTEWYRGNKQPVSIRNGVVSSCASGACSCANTQAVTLPAGEYKVTYDYYYTDADYDEAYLHPEKFTFKFALSNSADALALTDTTFGDEIVDKNKDKDIWNKGSMTVELADGFKHFGFSVQHSPYHTYIDNIKFYQKIAEEVTVTFETNGGSAVAPVTGYEKTAITVANPTKEGFEFTGWYEDAACTIPSDMKFKVGVTKLYAAWSQTDGSIRFDFDEYNAGFKSGNPFSGGMYAVTNDPIAQNGKTLGVNTNFGGDCHAVNRQILFNNGTQKTTLPAGIYKIDYKYYTRYASPSEYSAGSKTNLENAYNRIENATLAFGVVGANFKTADKNTLVAQTVNLLDLTQVTEGYQGQWTNGSVLIEITDDMVAAGNNNLVLSVSGVPFPVYLDDIRIYEAQLSDVTISFDSKGGSKVNKINTKSLLAVTLPTPTRNGYDFLGWFDVNGNPAKNTAPELDITYYAKWQEVGDHYLIDMDNGFLTGSTTVYGSAYFTVNSDKFAADAKHKNTLQYKFNNIGSILPRIHLLSSNNKVAKIKAETAYKVTFEYYVESLPTAPGVTFDFTTKHVNGHAYEPSGTVRLTGGNILNEITPKSTELVGKWIKKTMVFISPKEIGSATLGLYCSGDTGIAIYLDNIEISAMGSDDVVLNYVIPATGQTSTLIGKKGQTIDKSQIAPFASNYYDFVGWYLDADFITPHTSTKFPSKHTTIYGKTQLTKNGVHVNFDDYPWPKNTPGKTNPYVQAEKTGISHDGDGWVLKVDNTGNEMATDAHGFILNAGGDTLNINKNSSYAVTYSIYIKEPGNPGNFNYRFMQCSPTMNYPENMYDRYESIKLNDYKGKWITRSIICNSGPSKADVLSIRFNYATPKNTIFYIDDIIVREIPENYSAVLYSSDYGTAPNLAVVPKGTTIQLGKPTGYPSNYQFAGWNDGVILITDSTYIVTKSVRLIANFASNFVEDFEDFRSDGYTHKYDSYDDDWEIYDSKANGNSSGNVKSGRYSLHSLGKDPNFKAHSIFMNSKFSKNELVFNGIYTISMWVKTEAKPVHKLGAIEIGNNTTKTNSWSIHTDRFAIAPISEIADGQWHKISYTFTSLSRYLSIYVPGNIELFIDDIEVKFTPNSASSGLKIFEAYVPTLLSTDGTYVKPNADKDTLNDFELVKRTETVTQGGSQLITLITQNIGATIAIIAGAVVLLAGIAVGTIVFIKKRKAKGVK